MELKDKFVLVQNICRIFRKFVENVYCEKQMHGL